MKIEQLLFFLLIFIPCFCFPFTYDGAAYAAQGGKWKEAHEKLSTLLVEYPDSADILYDAGVASHNLDNVTQAQTYFLRAADCAQSNELKSQAYYNAGNAYVSNKKLKEALAEYDKALILDEHNEYIKHNRDVVARMLEQQEQEKEEQKEQEKEKQDQQKQENKDDQKSDSDDKQDQQDQDSGRDDDNDQKKQSDTSDSGKDKNKKDKNSDPNEGQDKSEESDGDEKGDKQESAENDKRDADQNPKDKSQNTKGEQDSQQGDKHDKSPDAQKEKETDTDTIAAEEKQAQDMSQQEGQSGQDKESEAAQALEQKLNDPWLMSILNQQEARDKAMNKRLMEAKISQHGGKNGQNCW